MLAAIWTYFFPVDELDIDTDELLMRLDPVPEMSFIDVNRTSER